MGWRDIFRRDKVQPVSDDRLAHAAEPPVSPRDRLVRALMEYGITNQDQEVDGLKELYRSCVVEMAEEERTELVGAFADLVEQRKLSINPLFAFLFQDPAPTVVASAVIAVVPMWMGKDSEDALFSTRQLCAFAEQLIEDGDEPRASAIYAGLLLLGDRRISEHLATCWRNLSSSGRSGLLQMRGMGVYAATVDWAIDWLEDCEGQEFGKVARMLSRMAEQLREHGQGVVEVRRALPLWREPLEPPLQVLHQWSFEAFSERISERLRGIARLETVDPIMPDVLVAWGVSLDGIATEEDVEEIRERSARFLANRGSIPPDAFRNSMRFPGVQVSPDAVLLRHPRAVAGWGLFNPYGPTLNIVGRTVGGEVDYLWYVMLNPFQQRWVVLGTLVGADRGTPGALIGMLREVFTENEIPLAHGDLLPLVAFPPAFVVNHGEVNPTEGEVLDLFRQSDGVRCYDLHGLIACQERGNGNPWHRATEQREGRTFARTGMAGERAGDAEAEAWMRAALSEEQFLNELIAFHEAWSGCLQHLRNTGNSDMADAAMPRAMFVQVSRDLGIPYFEVIANRLEEA